MAKKGSFRWVHRLITGCKNNTENWATEGREPQLHNAKLVQRRLCTVSLTFNAGSPFGTCVQTQRAFTAVVLKRKLSFLSDSGSQIAQKSTVLGQIRGYQSSTH